MGFIKWGTKPGNYNKERSLPGKKRSRESRSWEELSQNRWLGKESSSHTWKLIIILKMYVYMYINITPFEKEKRV